MARIYWTAEERLNIAAQCVALVAQVLSKDKADLTSAEVISYHGFFTRILPKAQECLPTERRRAITQYQMVPWLQETLDEVLLGFAQLSAPALQPLLVVAQAPAVAAAGIIDAVFADPTLYAEVLRRFSAEFVLTPRSCVSMVIKAPPKKAEEKVRKTSVLIFGLLPVQQQEIRADYAQFNLKFLTEQDRRRIRVMAFYDYAIAVTGKISHAADVSLQTTFGCRYLRVPNMLQGVRAMLDRLLSEREI